VVRPQRNRREVLSQLLTLLRKHRPFALSIARSWIRKLPPSVELCDIEQAALIGVFQWCRTHPDETADGWKGGLILRIRGSIKDELRRQDYLPRYVRKDNPHLQVRRFDDISRGLEERLEDDTESAAVLTERSQVIAEAMLAEMHPLDLQVIRQHYFGGNQFDEIAAEQGTTPARISQRHHRALDTMRFTLERNTRREERRMNAPRKGTRGMLSTLPEEGINLRAELARYQDSLVEQALARSGGNKAQAARLLGLNRTTLVEMLKSRSLIVPRIAPVLELKPLRKCGPKEER
jgi:RNA polymerase sigma factor (sigma-70 family)